MSATNCWEFKNCGREPGGHSCQSMGVCPAAEKIQCHGINHGKNAGRCCWAVASTFCDGKIQENFASKLHDCIKCSWYFRVMIEEGNQFHRHLYPTDP